MRAVVITKPGEPDVLQVMDKPKPQAAKGEAVVRIRAVGINRADLLQRQGHYPAPPDSVQDVPGLEFAGEVESIGDGVTEVSVGDRVYGLAGGGTYAEYIAVHARTLSPIPRNLTFKQAAAIPEAFITAYDAAVLQGHLSAGEYMLISAVGSGVGTAAVQIAKAIGARTVGTARSSNKLQEAHKLGMDHAVLVEDHGVFAEKVLACTGGGGVNVVLELVGGPYVAEDLKCMATKGRIIVVGLVAGAKCQTDLGAILAKRLLIKGTTLRRRPLEEKIEAAKVLTNHLNPLFENGTLKAIVDRTFPLEHAANAHAIMEQNSNFGKIVLEVDKPSKR